MPFKSISHQQAHVLPSLALPLNIRTCLSGSSRWGKGDYLALQGRGERKLGEVFYHWHCLELLVHVILESRITFSLLNSFKLSTCYAPLLSALSGHLRRLHVRTSLTWLYVWVQVDVFSACWRAGVCGGEQLTNEPWTITGYMNLLLLPRRCYYFL